MRKIELLVSRLTGYVFATAGMDGAFGDCSAEAYIAQLNKNDMHKALQLHLEQSSDYRYIYGDLFKLEEPFIRTLHKNLEGFFLQHPFSMENICNNEQLNKTRYNIVLRIVDLIGMITDDFSSKEIFCTSLKSNNGYHGYVYIFKLKKDFLILKTISRI